MGQDDQFILPLDDHQQRPRDHRCKDDCRFCQWRSTVSLRLNTAKRRRVYQNSTMAAGVDNTVWAPEIHKLNGKWHLYYSHGYKSYVIPGGANVSELPTRTNPSHSTRTPDLPSSSMTQGGLMARSSSSTTKTITSGPVCGRTGVKTSNPSASR